MNYMMVRTAQLQSNKQFHYLSRKIWGSFTKIMSRGKGMLEMAKIWLFGGTFLRLNSVPNIQTLKTLLEIICLIKNAGSICYKKSTFIADKRKKLLE